MSKKKHWRIHFLPQQACAKTSGAKQPKTIVSNDKGELEELCLRKKMNKNEEWVTYTVLPEPYQSEWIANRSVWLGWAALHELSPSGLLQPR